VHRSISDAAPVSRGSTVENATSRSGAAATHLASESFTVGEGRSRPSYVKTTETSMPNVSMPATNASGV
jgi:hypothetical protein